MQTQAKHPPNLLSSLRTIHLERTALSPLLRPQESLGPPRGLGPLGNGNSAHNPGSLAVAPPEEDAFQAALLLYEREVRKTYGSGDFAGAYLLAEALRLGDSSVLDGTKLATNTIVADCLELVSSRKHQLTQDPTAAKPMEKLRVEDHLGQSMQTFQIRSLERLRRSPDPNFRDSASARTLQDLLDSLHKSYEITRITAEVTLSDLRKYPSTANPNPKLDACGIAISPVFAEKSWTTPTLDFRKSVTVYRGNDQKGQPVFYGRIPGIGGPTPLLPPGSTMIGFLTDNGEWLAWEDTLTIPKATSTEDQLFVIHPFETLAERWIQESIERTDALGFSEAEKAYVEFLKQLGAARPRHHLRSIPGIDAVDHFTAHVAELSETDPRLAHSLFTCTVGGWLERVNSERKLRMLDQNSVHCTLRNAVSSEGLAPVKPEASKASVCGALLEVEAAFRQLHYRHLSEDYPEHPEINEYLKHHIDSNAVSIRDAMNRLRLSMGLSALDSPNPHRSIAGSVAGSGAGAGIGSVAGSVALGGRRRRDSVPPLEDRATAETPPDFAPGADQELPKPHAIAQHPQNPHTPLGDSGTEVAVPIRTVYR